MRRRKEGKRKTGREVWKTGRRERRGEKQRKEGRGR